MKEIFESDQAHARQIGRAPWSDALQELQGRLENRIHCTIIA